LKKKAEAMNRLIEFNKKYSEEVALAFSTAPVGLVLKKYAISPNAGTQKFGLGPSYTLVASFLHNFWCRI
jgi:hypothetical protein